MHQCRAFCIRNRQGASKHGSSVQRQAGFRIWQKQSLKIMINCFLCSKGCWTLLKANRPIHFNFIWLKTVRNLENRFVQCWVDCGSCMFGAPPARTSNVTTHPLRNPCQGIQYISNNGWFCGKTCDLEKLYDPLHMYCFLLHLKLNIWLMASWYQITTSVCYCWLPYLETALPTIYWIDNYSITARLEDWVVSYQWLVSNCIDCGYNGHNVYYKQP